MKQLVRFYSVLFWVAFFLSACVKKGHVGYEFIVYNETEVDMKVHLTSWGRYTMYINGSYDSRHKFQEVETIEPRNSLVFYAEVGGDPDPAVMPASLVMPWAYITAIECNGISVPSSYFSWPDNWENAVLHQINGTYSRWGLIITPELLEEFRVQAAEGKGEQHE